MNSLSFSTANPFAILPFSGESEYEFLDELFFGFPTLLGAKLGLSASSQKSDSHGRAFFYDDNEPVGLIRGGPCLHCLSLTPAYSSQILFQRVSDSFALQEVNSHAIPLQRVLIILSLLFRLLHLLVNSSYLELLVVQSVFFLLRKSVSWTLSGSLLDFRL